MKSKKFAVVAKECVACGTCVKVCPKKAITIDRGITAFVNPEACVGCRKCALVCPANVIIIEEAKVDEKTLV